MQRVYNIMDADYQLNSTIFGAGEMKDIRRKEERKRGG